MGLIGVVLGRLRNSAGMGAKGCKMGVFEAVWARADGWADGVAGLCPWGGAAEVAAVRMDGRLNGA